ncbi:DUF3048 domain-containing protein [bacterium]|nr:DUF3048 domain-containing protein [bacterium]
MQKQNNWLYLIPVALFIVSLCASMIVFRVTSGLKPAQVTPSPVAETQESEPEDESLIAGVDTLPKTEACPLNGVLYSQPEREAWESRRPLAVMIENSVDARPQSGLADADLVFEAVAEGGITRFMAMYYCDAQSADVTLAPIRSARTYFINLASGFNRPMYVHVGGANLEGPANALGQLNDYGWTGTNDINQFSVGYPTFIRDYNRIPGKDIATEHTMTTSTEKLWEVAQKRGWTNVSPKTKVGSRTVDGEDWAEGFTGWDYNDDQAGSGSQTVSYQFWSGLPNFDVSWKYDSASGKYLRSNGGEPATDLNTGEQLAYDNVIVMFVEEEGPIDELKHMLYTVIGKGDGLYFFGGEATPIKWSKKSRESELQFTDKNGKPLTFARGTFWISLVPDTNDVDY